MMDDDEWFAIALFSLQGSVNVNIAAAQVQGSSLRKQIAGAERALIRWLGKLVD